MHRSSSNRRFGFGIAIGVMYVTLIAITITTLATGQELRPSEHGLEYQNESPAGKKSTEMKTFFQGSSSSSESAAAESVSVEQPRATNTSDPSWWSSWGKEGRRSEEGKKDHVKKVVLLVVSLVCGVTGVALLVAAAFVFLFQFQRGRRTSSSSSAPASSPQFQFHDKL